MADADPKNVDHFKRVNDTHGHAVGDQILRMLGAVIRHHQPANSVSARLGGEEFVILLTGSDLGAAGSFAEAIRTQFAAAARQYDTRLSAGIAYQRRREALGQLLRRADEAVYAAKAAGRDRAVVAP
ncbi:MAG: GGDEF domain-containing protein [Proteobacteria bacterium]|nr:GGDEF domain-containing protein [Pseudomonadota bacterium]